MGARYPTIVASRVKNQREGLNNSSPQCVGLFQREVLEKALSELNTAHREDQGCLIAR